MDVDSYVEQMKKRYSLGPLAQEIYQGESRQVKRRRLGGAREVGSINGNQVTAGNEPSLFDSSFNLQDDFSNVSSSFGGSGDTRLEERRVNAQAPFGFYLSLLDLPAVSDEMPSSNTGLWENFRNSESAAPPIDGILNLQAQNAPVSKVSPLELRAQKRDNLAIVEAIWKGRKDFYGEAYTGDELIFEYLSLGNEEAVEYLIKEKNKLKPRNNDASGSTLATYVLRQFKAQQAMKWLKKLEEWGVDLKALDGQGLTPLLVYAGLDKKSSSKGENKAIWRTRLFQWLLRKERSDINAADPVTGETAMMKIIKNEYAYTPLFRRRIVELLLAREANTAIKDLNGETAIEIAQRLNCQEIFELLRAANS